MGREIPFDSIYKHGFVRLAIATPRVALADPTSNARRTIVLGERPVACQSALVVNARPDV